MPYIPRRDRSKFDHHIEALVNDDLSVGQLNYIISRMIWMLWQKKRGYTLGNNLIGVLECVKAEFYRRMLAPYEDVKAQENGDLDYE